MIFLAIVGSMVWWFYPVLRLQFSNTDYQELNGKDRLRVARWRHGGSLRRAFAAASVEYPPSEIFLRVFKQERRLELWARHSGPIFKLVQSYGITESSGTLGPKRREGDRQVPEGFYEVDRFNPESSFHLSLGLNYPNSSDSVRSDKEKPGFDIYIHGGDVSIGCMPLGDDHIEEVFLSAWDAKAQGQKRIRVHIFPAIMEGPAWEHLLQQARQSNPSLASFWDELYPGYEAFEKNHIPPAVSVEPGGIYRVTPIEP